MLGIKVEIREITAACADKSKHHQRHRTVGGGKVAIKMQKYSSTLTNKITLA